MKKEDIQQIMWEQHKSGLLITPKHDPYQVGHLILPKRSVISYDITDDVFKFIDTGIQRIFEYHNISYLKTPKFIEIIPSFDYCAAASGVTSYSTVVTSTLDRIIAVNGFYKGLHIYGEDRNNIYRRIAENKLKYKTEIK